MDGYHPPRDDNLKESSNYIHSHVEDQPEVDHGVAKGDNVETLDRMDHA